MTVTGKVLPVENTKYDLREFVQLGKVIKTGGAWPDEGFDNFFVINDANAVDKKADYKNVAS